jgi:hypothetical protein
MPKIDHKAFDVLGEMIRPPAPVRKTAPKEWMPDLNPSQEKIFFAEKPYVLAWGEKYSGKTIGCLHRVMKHAYENKNAFVIILTRTGNMSTDGGAWHKLITDVLPQWEDGLGIVSKKHSDKQHNELMWVTNCHGGKNHEWSLIMNTSAPNPEQLAERFKGREPSMVFVDELTSCSTDQYFKAIAAQLGRRPMVPEKEQVYLAATNPDSPDHWVYERFFGEDGEGMGPEYETIYCPKEENYRRVGESYFKKLEATYRGDDVGSAWMISGMWVPRASGDGLFKDIYQTTMHVRPLNAEGNPHTKMFLRPHADHPMIIGLDSGSAFNAFSFQQWLPMEGKNKWVIFDEIVTIKKRISFDDFIPLVMRRIRWWRDEVGKEMPMVWISDNSAFNQFRQAAGSFDVLEIERIYDANRVKYRLEPLKVRPCPKFNGSKPTRTRIGQKLLADGEVIVSSLCSFTQKMFLRIESKRQKPGEPIDPEGMLTAQRGDYVHIWDAVSYPWLAASMSPTAVVPSTSGGQAFIQSAA